MAYNVGVIMRHHRHIQWIQQILDRHGSLSLDNVTL